MAWADLPALYIRPVRHGAIPIGDPHRMRLGIEDISLEFSHQRALPGGVRLVQHLFVERHLVWIFELGVIAAEDRAGKVALYVEHRVRYSVQLAAETTSKSPRRIASSQGRWAPPVASP